MGAAGYAIDEITAKLVEAAGYMLVPAYVFAPVKGIETLMPIGKGGPGTLAEGSVSWQDAAAALNRAKTQLDTLSSAVSADEWSGDDREQFDAKARQLSEQLGIAGEYAQNVGAALAALAVPLGAYGGVCLGIGGVLLGEAIAYWSAVASVVGNLGASEALLAAGTATAGICLGVLGGVVIGYAAIMDAAAIGIAIGTRGDVNDQAAHGDADAQATFVKARAEGLKEVGENLEKFAVSVGGDLAAGAITKGAGLPEHSLLAHAVEGGISKDIENVNAAVDVVKGEGPGTVLADLTGYKDEIDAAADLFGLDDPPKNDHEDVQYSLPQPPPPQPRIIPIPNAVPGEGHVVPAVDKTPQPDGEGTPA